MNKKRKSLITAGIVVLIICLLSSISSAVIYDYKNIKIRQVTVRGDNFNPEWSPDGSKILFERKYLGSWDIFVMTLSEAIIPATTPSPSPVATINISVTPTPTQPIPTPATPSPTLTPIHSPTSTPSLTPTPTVTPTEFPTTEEKGVPGFEAVSAIVGLLAVVYLLRRRR
jgi:PGF-CTERM protein